MDMSIFQIARMTDAEAREMLEASRWPDGPVCPHCGSKDHVTRLQGEKHRKGLLKCRACRKQFSVTVNTVMERSKIPLALWIAAFYLECSSKKGISACQIQRMLKVTYKTAWFMMHRIRHAMQTDEYAADLAGTVEVDETYVGGKPRKGGPPSLPGRGTKKTPVMVLVSRDGEARTGTVERVNADTLHKAITDNVARSARLVTDEFPSYRGIGYLFGGGHHTVNHGVGEYSRGDVHTNTAESFFALLKRGVYGTYHHVGKNHLDKYCDAFAFRWNHRKVSDGARTKAALASIGGKRLTYAD